MRNPFKKKPTAGEAPAPETDETKGLMDVVEIPLTQLVRWALYDAQFPSPSEVAQALGMSVVSDEGEQIERRESDERSACIARFEYLINIYAGVIARLCATQHLIGLGEKYDESDLDDMSMVYEQVARATLWGFLSAFHHTGLIDVHMKTGFNASLEERQP